MTGMSEERPNIVDYVASKFEDDGSGELSQMMTPIEGLLWELLVEAKRLNAELAATKAENERLRAGRIVDILVQPQEGDPFPLFVEVESPPGHSINFGEWVGREDGYLALRFKALPEAAP